MYPNAVIVLTLYCVHYNIILQLSCSLLLCIGYNMKSMKYDRLLTEKGFLKKN